MVGKQVVVADVIKSIAEIAMKKFSLAVLGMYLGILSAFSQNSQKADSAYKSRKLKLEEVNIVSSYYQQNGDKATVTGGIGSQKLTDISNSIDLKLVRYDKKNRRHSFSFDLMFQSSL